MVKRWLGSVFIFTMNAVLQVSGFVILARALGPAEFAAIIAATTVASIAVEFVGFGSGDLLVRRVSRASTSYAEAFGDALMLNGLTIFPVTAIGLAIVVAAFEPSHSLWVLAILLIGELLFARTLLLSEQIAIAHDAVGTANFYRMFSAVIRFVFVLVATLAVGVSSAAAWSFWYLAAVILSIAGTTVHAGIRFGGPRFKCKVRLADTGVMFSAMQVLRALQFSVDKFAVGSIANETILGVYGTASRVAQFAFLPGNAVLRMTYPMFFRDGAEGIRASARLAKRLAPPLLAIGLSSSGILLLASIFATELMGSAYLGLSDYLMLLAPLPFLAALQNLAGDVLTGADRQKSRVLALVVGVASTWLLTWTGIVVSGVVGAIVGFMVGQVLTCALMIGIVVWQVTKSPHTTLSRTAGDVRN